MEENNQANITYQTPHTENSQQANITGNNFEQTSEDAIQLTIVVYITMVVCGTGMCTNSINIFTFAYAGLSDSIAVSFFVLSITDFGFLTLIFSYQLLANLNERLGLTSYLDLEDASNVVNFYALLCVDISTPITVFIAVQKCACVAIPFLFKNVFTRSRAIGICLGIVIVFTVLYIPLLASLTLPPKNDSRTNTTRLRLAIGPIFFMGFRIFANFNRIFVPFAAQVILLVCTVVLTIKLKQALKRRRKMTNKGEKSSSHTDAEKPTDKYYLNAKEIRAVQVVTFVSVIFVLCNTPDLISFLVGKFIPEFYFEGSYRTSYLLLRFIQNLLACINSSINIIIYLKFNTKYRETFKTICLSCPPEVQQRVTTTSRTLSERL